MRVGRAAATRIVVAAIVSFALPGIARAGFIPSNLVDPAHGAAVVTPDHPDFVTSGNARLPQISTAAHEQDTALSEAATPRPSIKPDVSSSVRPSEGSAPPVPPKVQSISLKSVGIDSVPEPSSAVILAFLSAGLLIRRRR